MNFRYKKIAYVALNVTDPERSSAFMQDVMGLEPVAAAARDVRFLRCDNHHHSIALYRAAAPGLRRVAFEMESERDLDAADAHLRGLGIRTAAVAAEERAQLGLARALRFTEPTTGLTVELAAPLAKVHAPFQHTLTQIARLGHVVVGTTQYAKSVEFFRDRLNFRVSDEVNGWITFMRCFPNPFHHSLGISAAPENRLHHVNFMVTDMDDIGRALYRLKKNNVPIVFGPGRHPPSGSVFLYFLDPDGMTMEFSVGMEEFPEAQARDGRVLPPAMESFDYWGGNPPDPRFACTGRIVAEPQ
jgi:2,3-dihydroxy-p-cumate/2,3-dihydroxybenzoate 3,4-dioxygenase